MYELQFGFRRGWPNLTTRQIVTHAVWRITGIHGLAHNGTPQGYTGGAQGGMAVFDTDSLVGRNADGTVNYDLTNGQVAYSWFNQILNVSDRHYLSFYNGFEQHAGGMTYTGVGANCYTPIVRALNDLLADIIANGPDPGEGAQVSADITRVLTFLQGQNMGMGTRITNEGIASGAVMFACFAMTALISYMGGGTESTGQTGFNTLADHLSSGTRIT